MSEVLFGQITTMLGKVSEDIHRMEATTAGQVETLLGLMDDLAANLNAIQAVLVGMRATAPADMDTVRAWLADNTDTEGQGYHKALALAEFIATGTVTTTPPEE